MTLESVEILEERHADLDQVEAPRPDKAHRRGLSRSGLIWRRLRSKTRFWIGAVAIAALVLWVVIGPYFTQWTIDVQDVNYFNYPPTSLHWFGTDIIGHDVYIETIVGLQKSLIIGFVAGPLSTILSAIIGAIAGYIGGKTDGVISWFINLMLVLPSFFILVLLFPFTHGSWVVMMFFLAITDWMIMAQVVRSQTKSLKEREFVKAARYMGFNAWTVVTRHILPNVASLLIIDAALGVGAMILAETTLSFLGFGVQAPDVSIGTLLSNAEAAAVTRPWLFMYPAGVLVILLFAINLVGDALRDAVDPTSGVNRS